MHPDQPREDRVAGEVEDLSVGRCGDTTSDAGDFASVDDDGLVLESRCAGAVDDAHVLEHLHWRVLAIKISGTNGGRSRSLSKCSGRSKSERKKQSNRSSHGWQAQTVGSTRDSFKKPYYTASPRRDHRRRCLRQPFQQTEVLVMRAKYRLQINFSHAQLERQ